MGRGGGGRCRSRCNKPRVRTNTCPTWIHSRGYATALAWCTPFPRDTLSIPTDMAGQPRRTLLLPAPAIARALGQEADRAALVSRFIAEAGRSSRIIAWTCNASSQMCDVHFGGNHRAKRDVCVSRVVWDAFVKDARETDPPYVVREEKCEPWWDGAASVAPVSVWYIAHPETPEDHFGKYFTRL